MYRTTSSRNIFFFSSRRRHTRLVSDWSSDVCSSDLPTGATSIEITIAFFGAQTEFLPTPGAVSFKRLLGRRSPMLTAPGTSHSTPPQRGTHRPRLQMKVTSLTVTRPAEGAEGAPRSLVHQGC